RTVTVTEFAEADRVRFEPGPAPVEYRGGDVDLRTSHVRLPHQNVTLQVGVVDMVIIDCVAVTGEPVQMAQAVHAGRADGSAAHQVRSVERDGRYGGVSRRI